HRQRDAERQRDAGPGGARRDDVDGTGFQPVFWSRQAGSLSHASFRGAAMNGRKPLASLSLDLDNKWSYLKTHGDAGWESYPTYLPLVVPRVLEFLRQRGLTITFFLVGQDAARAENRDVLRSIAEAGHEVGNHSFKH